MHRGIPNGSDNWVWSSAPVYAQYNGVVRWSNARPSQNFSFDSQSLGSGTYTDPSSFFPVRCIGLPDQSKAVVPTPTCNGGCFTTTNRAAPLKADQTDRPTATWDSAIATCRANGGELPKLGDFAELVHAGWPGSGSYLWIADALYYASGGAVTVPLGRWTGNANPFWTFSNGGGVNTANGSQPYRCIYRSKQGSLPTCEANQLIQQQADGSYECIEKLNGNSGGQANGSEFVDALGNAWDGTQRTAANYANASNTCQTLGGRLPTSTEIWAVRANQTDRPSLGTISSTDWLWTTIPSFQVGYRVLIRVSAGDATYTSEPSTHAYRCIWPSTRSNVLSGSQCVAPAAGGECFRVGDDYIFDVVSRPAQFATSAIKTCLDSGGSLLDTRDFAHMVQGGAPWGMDDWLWMADFAAFAAGSGHAIGRWSGTGTVAWRFDGANGTVASFSSYYGVRCGYTTRLR
jgi:hypothetical protein